MLTLIGLGILVLAWAYQLAKVTKGKREIDTVFVALYALGVLVLVIDGFRSGLPELAVLNLLSFLAAVLVGASLAKKN